MGYGNQSKGDYAEEKFVFEDPERIKAFLSDLNVAGNPEGALEPDEVDEDVSVTATYRLEHPYRGESFSRALLHDEEVVAAVEVEADVSGDYGPDYIFSGTIKDNAYDVFNPPEISENGQSEAMNEEAVTGDSSVTQGVATD